MIFRLKLAMFSLFLSLFGSIQANEGISACNNWILNPPAYLTCSNLEFRFDFFWWRASEIGLDLGSENRFKTYESEEKTYVFDRSFIKTIDPAYEPGFRLGVNYICPCECGWDAALIWTHFHSKAKPSGDGKDEIFESYWERYSGYSSLRVDGKLALYLDLLDLEVGRKYYVASCFVLRPYFGLRGGRFDQSYKVHSLATDSIDHELNLENTYLAKTKSKQLILALGPRIGCMIEWDSQWGFSVFGDGAVSILYGTNNLHSKERLRSLDGSKKRSYFEKASPYHSTNPVADLSIGLKWDRNVLWCNHCFPLSLVAAWEHHAFWDFNHMNFMSEETQASKKGDLFTQGLTLSALIGF